MRLWVQPTLWSLTLVLLTQSPFPMTHYSLRDVKDAESSYSLLFACGEATQRAGQITCVVLRPHFVDLTFSRDLKEYFTTETTLIQCTENLSMQANWRTYFLRNKIYSQRSLSWQKLQNVLKKVPAIVKPKLLTLNLLLSGIGACFVQTSQSLRIWIDPSQLNLIHSKQPTIKLVRAFLSMTGYSRNWVPGYSEIAKPLYPALKEDQSWGLTKCKWVSEF